MTWCKNRLTLVRCECKLCTLWGKTSPGVFLVRFADQFFCQKISKIAYIVYTPYLFKTQSIPSYSPSRITINTKSDREVLV